MTIEQLNYVIVLSEELSFTNACQRLHLTQPALSQSIKTLENQLGEVANRQPRLSLIGIHQLPPLP